MKENLQDAMIESYNEAKDNMLEAVKAIKAQAVRPADPNATKVTGQAARDQYQQFLNSPQFDSQFLELQDKYNLAGTDNPIPKRFVDYIVSQEKKNAQQASGS